MLKKGLFLFLAWFVASIPFGLVIGRMLARRSALLTAPVAPPAVAVPEREVEDSLVYRSKN
ncbi:MAG: hypothetical protein GYB65_01685 [Chloroflexi bacterium]|nr:hypothetical protein [Chloroflexota bacterium]